MSGYHCRRCAGWRVRVFGEKERQLAPCVGSRTGVGGSAEEEARKFGAECGLGRSWREKSSRRARRSAIHGRKKLGAEPVGSEKERLPKLWIGRGAPLRPVQQLSNNGLRPGLDRGRETSTRVPTTHAFRRISLHRVPLPRHRQDPPHPSFLPVGRRKGAGGSPPWLSSPPLAPSVRSPIATKRSNASKIKGFALAKPCSICDCVSCAFTEPSFSPPQDRGSRPAAQRVGGSDGVSGKGRPSLFPTCEPGDPGGRVRGTTCPSGSSSRADGLTRAFREGEPRGSTSDNRILTPGMNRP